MGASLYIGRNLRMQAGGGDDGGVDALAGDGLECENMSWASITEVRYLGQALGVPAEVWPFYADVELEQDFPLGDIRKKCEDLRSILGSVTPEDLPENYWIRRFHRALADGFEFCAKAW